MDTLFIHPFLPQKKLFKAYDIRGDVMLFTDDFVWALAKTFAHGFVAAQSHTTAAAIVIGYDARKQSQEIAQFFAFACAQVGLRVHWLGLSTTPMMAYTAQQLTGNGLIVTASHSQKDINGIKWLINHESPSSEDIEHVFAQLAHCTPQLPDTEWLSQIKQLPTNDVTTDEVNDYLAAIHTALAHVNAPHNLCVVSAFAPKRIVIDCMNGATSLFAEALFSQLGAACIMLNNTPDGNFPKGNPDPTEANRLCELAYHVLACSADIGLAFDGDGDRLMVIDAKGHLVSPDHLLYLLSRICLEERPPSYPATSKVIFDVKCSHHVASLLAQQGAVPTMAKTGSSLMRKSLQNKSDHAIFAGELSGHFIFNDGYFVLHDDAMYAAARLINWLYRQPRSLVDILNELPPCVSTADMYLPVKDADAGQKIITRIIAMSKKPFTRLKSSLDIKNIYTIDGLRLDFASGFGILRKSNTGNFLTVRFCANTIADLRYIQTIFVNLCRRVDDHLAEQVAQIQPI